MKTGLLGIVGLAMLVIASRASADVFWRCDFDDPDFKDWHNVQKGTHPDNLHMVSTGPLANGKHALDIHVYPDDYSFPPDQKVFNNRDELSMSAAGIPTTHSGLNQTAYYRIGYYFPDDLNANQHGHNTITQFHAVDSTAAPPLDLDIEEREGPIHLELLAKGGPERAGAKKFNVGGVPTNAWVEIILGVHWSATDGWIEAWRRDGLQGDWNNIVPRANVGTLYETNAEKGAFLKMGYYRGPDGKIGKATGPWNQTSHLIIGYILAGDTLDDARNANP
jgi:hypothetical protein